MTSVAHIIPLKRPHGPLTFDVWLYDADKPRDLSATDPCARYSVLRYVDSFTTRAAAWAAADQAVEEASIA